MPPPSLFSVVVTGHQSHGGHGEDRGRDEAQCLCGVLVVTSMLSKVKADQQGSLPQCGPWGAGPPGALGVGFPRETVIKPKPQ